MSDINKIELSMMGASNWEGLRNACLLLADAVERLQSAPVIDSDRIARRDRNANDRWRDAIPRHRRHLHNSHSARIILRRTTFHSRCDRR